MLLHNGLPPLVRTFGILICQETIAPVKIPNKQLYNNLLIGDQIFATGGS